MDKTGLIWLLFGICLVLSFVLSGMEAGVFALSRLRVRQQMRAGRRSAKVLHEFLEHPENFLWTILVGNTVANFIILGWLIRILEQALGRRIRFRCIVALARRQSLHGPSLRQPRRTAADDAGIIPGANFGRTRDDKSGAGPAKPHGAPGRYPAANRNQHHRSDSA